MNFFITVNNQKYIEQTLQENPLDNLTLINPKELRKLTIEHQVDGNRVQELVNLTHIGGKIEGRAKGKKKKEIAIIGKNTASYYVKLYWSNYDDTKDETKTYITQIFRNSKAKKCLDALKNGENIEDTIIRIFEKGIKGEF